MLIFILMTKGIIQILGLIMSNAIRLKYIKPKLKLDKNLIIVGSSSKLLNFDGKKIDQFDSVVRFNRAPTIGYEDFVGNKTSLRVMNNHTFDNFDLEDRFTGQPRSFIPNLKDQNILRFSFGKPKINWEEEYDSSINHFFFNYKKINKLKNIFNYNSSKLMMTGTAFICLCVLSGLKPNIIGFETKKQIHHHNHYWEELDNEASPSHEKNEDMKVINNLINSREVNSIEL